MKPPPNREVALFSAALELPASQRAAYLEENCADDPALRLRVEALLRVHEEAIPFLESPPPGAQASPVGAEPAGATARLSGSPAEKAGDRIGRYKLLQQIGEGGCGVVYMAEQEDPVRRRVALKVIKLGMDTKQVIARFEAERQALALMDHPNIAKVLDAGATETGRPYFVMELVRGIKITDYCDEHSLPTEERLKLFMQVCQAIQHAHQKGVIHRDIKPSNILVSVTEPGGPGCPKVIDFGIAKATTGQRLTDKTVFTAFEQFIGTPAYMSPEQAQMTSLDIDTRTDIYALGVLLYELLTGQTPFDAKDLMAAGLDAMRRIICEKEPARPSTRLSTMLDVERTLTAKHRHTDAPKLAHLLRGDLDWIVMKALEKDRARRYETANGLAMDLQRHLDNEPVLACPPSRLYEFQKTVRRHKFGFGATAALIVVLAVGGLLSTLEAIRAQRAEQEQMRLRQQAEENEKKMQTEATEIIHILLGSEVLAPRKFMDAGKLREAEALTREAITVQRKLHGGKNNELVSSLALLATILIREGKLDEAISTYREALAIGKDPEDGDSEMVLGLRHFALLLADRLESLGKHGEAEEIFVEFTGYARTNSALILFDGGEIFARHGRWKEADDIFTKFFELQPTDPRIHHALAPVLAASGDLEQYREFCQLIVSRFDDNTDPFVADRMAKDCLILPSSGADLNVVGRMADSAVVAGSSNAFIAYFQCTKGLAEYRLGHFASALSWLDKTIYIGGHRGTHEWDDYLYVEAYAVSAMAHFQLKQPDEARTAFAKANEIAEAKLPKLESGNIGGIWRDWIIAHILLSEAKSLIEGKPTHQPAIEE